MKTLAKLIEEAVRREVFAMKEAESAGYYGENSNEWPSDRCRKAAKVAWEALERALPDSESLENGPETKP